MSLLIRSVAVLALCFSAAPALAKDYRDEYKALLASECSAKKRGSTDERELSWGCTKEKTQQLDSFRLKLENRLEAVMKAKGLEKSTRQFREAWESYQKAAQNFDLDFHLPGSMGTSLRFQSEQQMVKQRVELLMQYLLDYYELDEVK